LGKELGGVSEEKRGGPAKMAAYIPA